MAKEPSKIVEYWLNEIKAAKKREERYRKVGKDVLSLYEADEETETPFNILYSNTETLRPALFSAQPRAVVQRRFKDEDPLGKLSADAGRRMLEFTMDTNREGYETLYEAMGSATLDALLPGRGLVTVKYDANFHPLPEPRPPDDKDEAPVKGKPVAEEAEEPGESEEAGVYADKEQVCFESIVWDRVYLGYAKKWHQVPWIAYAAYLTKEEVADLLGTSIAKKLKYQASQETSENDRPKGRKDDEDVGERRTTLIYQIWDKAGGKKVRYISATYKDDELKVEEDPLGLTGFFNTPRPLMFIEKSSTLTPTAPYQMYKSQADELNRLTRRIKRITEAIKARGLYDSSISGDLEKLMMADDNALVPAEVASSLATEKGFQNAIWFLPLEVLIAVLQQLYQARESCKQTIYEITGISDIIRGSTSASETATAQSLKSQWGTLRLKRLQAEVARYVRDLLRMALELGASKFSEETWAQMTGLPFVTSQQRMFLEQQAATITMMQPEAQQQLQAELAKPVWGQVLELLKNDLTRTYRIDVETNSTVEPEAVEDQKHLNELFGMLGQLMNGLGPLVQSGALPFEALQQLLLFAARRFRMGSELEDQIKKMQPPKPPQEDNGKAEAMQKQIQIDKQMAMKEIEGKKKEAGMSLKEQDMQHKMDAKQREMDLQLREMQLQVKEQQFGMEQRASQALMGMQKNQVEQELSARHEMQSMKEKKYNVESVVNKKTDTVLDKVLKAVQQIQESQAQLVAALSPLIQGNSMTRQEGLQQGGSV